MSSTEFPSQIISNIFESTINLTKYASIYFDFLNLTISNRRPNLHANNSTENVPNENIEPHYPIEEFSIGDHSVVPFSQLVTRAFKLFNSNCLCWWITGRATSKPNQSSRVMHLIYMGLAHFLKLLEKDSNKNKNTLDSRHTEEPKFNSLQKEVLDDTAAILTSKGLQFSKNGDYASSVKMLRRASELGSSTASYDMGLAYFKGMGVERNIELALSYFEKASIIGHEKSKQNAIFLRKRILYITEI